MLTTELVADGGEANEMDEDDEDRDKEDEVGAWYAAVVW